MQGIRWLRRAMKTGVWCSFALSAVAAVCWYSSLSSSATLRYVEDDRWLSVRSDVGVLSVAHAWSYFSDDPEPNGWTWEFLNHELTNGPLLGRRSTFWGRLGFTYDLSVVRGSEIAGHVQTLQVPWWSIMVTSAVPLSLISVVKLHAVMNRRRRRYRVLHSLCPRCGYDVRASKERCPECGSGISLADTTSSGDQEDG